MTRKCILFLAALATIHAVAQTSAPVENLPLPPGAHHLMPYTSVMFRFVGRDSAMPSWEISLGNEQERTGTYRLLNDPSAQPLPITVSEATMAILTAADEARLRNSTCETKLKNIAKTGEKTLTYTMGVSVASCMFNYSDDEKLNEIAAAFQAIATTIQAGEKLKHDKRFDHLGLEADLDRLLGEAKEKRAIEFQNIATVLRNIAEDDELMTPSRRKAQVLLDQAGSVAPPRASAPSVR